MKKLFIIFVIFNFSLLANTNSKIKDTKHNLYTNTKKEKKILSSLEEISNKITTYKKGINKIKVSMSKLSSDIKKSKLKSHEAKKKLDKISKIISSINSKRTKVNKKLVEILSKEIKFNIIKQSNSFNANISDLINLYINKSYSKVLKDKFNKTKLKSLSLKLDLAYAKDEYDKLNSKVASLLNKKEQLKKYENLKKNTLSKLKKEQKKYSKKLQLVRKQNRQLTSLLKKLNIIKEQHDREHTIKITKKPQNEVEVRRVESSYTTAPVTKYRGSKTIAPFKKYKIVRKFGSFTDPNYKIKMFNPNVVLKPIGSKNVINILDGKVISITNTPPIGNIVIVQNKNGLHTLYAKLSTIAPTIKRGNHIKKGYILGKVKDELFFEVTKNNTNINPLRLIR